MTNARTELKKTLSTKPRQDLSNQFAKASSVALLLTGDLSDLELLFIERATNPKDHWSGHIAFPGGRVDAGDPSMLAACQREVHEELGFFPEERDLLGCLNDLQARKRGTLLPLFIRPFVFYLSEKPEFQLQPSEVAGALWIPVRDLWNLENQTQYLLEREGSSLKLPAIRFPEGRILWGLTYMMVHEFLAKTEEL